MKVEWRTTLGAAVFLGAACAVYYFWSTESTGSVLLLFGAAAYLMLAGYLILQWTRRDRIPRPEDAEDGNYADTAGEHLGFFPAASIWPAGMGLGATFIGIALIFGTWYWLVGLTLLIGAIIGFAVESEAPDDPPVDAVEAAHRTDSAALPGDVGAGSAP